MENLLNDLNAFLCDLNVFYRKLQNYHWNVKGKQFFTIHLKLEEYYNEVNEQIDEVAEHILSLKGQPLGTMKDYLAKTKIEEAMNEKIKYEEVLENIIKDYDTLLDECITIKEHADEVSEYKTSAMIDGYIGEYSKKLWMLNQSCE